MPGPHGSHAVAAKSDAKCPIGQARQALAPEKAKDGWKVPGAQAVHVVLAGWAAYVPPTHGSQKGDEEEGADAKVPAGHAAHPPFGNVSAPGAQRVHAVA